MDSPTTNIGLSLHDTSDDGLLYSEEDMEVETDFNSKDDDRKLAEHKFTISNEKLTRNQPKTMGSSLKSILRRAPSRGKAANKSIPEWGMNY